MKPMTLWTSLAIAVVLVAGCGGSEGAKTRESDGSASASTAPTSGSDEPATTTGTASNGLFDSGAAITLVDGLAYDLCALVPAGTASLSSFELRPESLYELGGQGWPSDPEGSVTCEWTANDGSSFFRVVAWTDDALRVALDDDSVTARERLARWKDDRRAQAAANGFPTLEVPQADGWLDTDVDEYDTNSLGAMSDSVVVAVQSMNVDQSCSGTDEEIHACQQTRLDAFEPDARSVAEAVLAGLLKGDGEPASWPSLTQPAESISVTGAQGEVDVCGLAGQALSDTLGVGYTLQSAYETEDSSTGAGPIITCDLEAVDRDRYPHVLLDVADVNTTGWDLAVEAGRSDIEGTLPGPIADESFVDRSTMVWMRAGSIWVRAMSFLTGSSSYDSRVVEALSFLATRL